MRLCRVKTTYKGEKTPVICNNRASEYRQTETRQPTGEVQYADLYSAKSVRNDTIWAKSA